MKSIRWAAVATAVALALSAAPALASGTCIDPNGRVADQGSGIDPNGLGAVINPDSRDTGGAMDPNGRASDTSIDPSGRGWGIDPNGRGIWGWLAALFSWR